MRVDVHTHYLPAPYLDAVDALDRGVGVERRDGRAYVVHPHDTFPLFDGFVDLDARLGWMDEHGIDVGLLSNSKPNPNDDPFTPAEAVSLARTLNDGFAAARDAHPDRLNALGVLPFRDPEAAVAELDRIVHDLDLAGVGIHTAVGGRKLSHPDLRPVFDRIDELDVGVFIHPGYNCLTEALGDDEWIFNPLVMFPAETTFQLARLLFDGFFDRHSFDVVIAHLGGALPYLGGRIDLGRTIGEQRFGDDAFGVPDRPVGDYLARFHYDAIVHSPAAMRFAADVVGPDRLCFGTDYPFESEDVGDVERDVEALDLGAADRAAIEGDTAARVFDL